MSDWQEFKADAGRFFDKATKEAIRLGDTATLYVKIKNLELKLDEEYAKLGRFCYRKLKQNADNAAQIDTQLEAISALQTSVKTLRTELEKLKQKDKQ